MTDISRAERRLIAALDRLDHAVERGARRIAQAAVMPPERGAAAQDSASDAPVSAEIALLHNRQAATLEAMQMRLAEAHERLASAGAQAARLAAANDELSRANRALIDAASGDWAGQGTDATRAALEAEIEALRAARTAEIAQMAEILDALDRMLGVTTTPRSYSTDARRGAGDRAAAGALADRGAAKAAAPEAVPSTAAAEAGLAQPDLAKPGGAKPGGAKPEPAAPAPRELTVIPDDDLLPEDMPAPDSDDDLPESDLPDTIAPDDDPRQTGSAPLFGGVYDDDPGAMDDADPADEERR